MAPAVPRGGRDHVAIEDIVIHVFSVEVRRRHPLAAARRPHFGRSEPMSRASCRLLSPDDDMETSKRNRLDDPEPGFNVDFWGPSALRADRRRSMSIPADTPMRGGCLQRAIASLARHGQSAVPVREPVACVVPELTSWPSSTAMLAPTGRGPRRSALLRRIQRSSMQVVA